MLLSATTALSCTWQIEMSKNWLKFDKKTGQNTNANKDTHVVKIDEHRSLVTSVACVINVFRL